MTTRSPRSRCQSNARRRHRARCRARCWWAKPAATSSTRSTATPARTRSKSSSLVSVGGRCRRPARRGPAGGRGPRRPPPPAAGHGRHRKSKTLPPSVSVPSKSKAATSGMGSSRPSAPAGLDRRPAAAGPRRRSRAGAASGIGRGQAVEAERDSTRRAPRQWTDPTGRAADRRSLRRQVWGRAASSWAQATASGQGRARRDDPVDQTHGQGLVGADLAPVRMRSRARPCPISRGRRTVPPSMSGTPKRRQNTPKDGVLGGHPQIAPDGELETAGHGVPLDGGDDRLGELQAGRAHRAGAVLGDPVAVAPGHGLEIGAGAEGPAAPVSTATADGRRRRRR